MGARMALNVLEKAKPSKLVLLDANKSAMDDISQKFPRETVKATSPKEGTSKQHFYVKLLKHETFLRFVF